MSKVKTDKIKDEEAWFISYTDDVKHHGHVYAGQQITTTQEHYKEFKHEHQYLARCEELNIVVEEDPV